MTLTKPYVVGIDIGGTNTAFGIVDTHYIRLCKCHKYYI